MREAISAKAERVAKRLGGPTVCESCLERELESSRGPAVTIHDAGDPIEAEMLVEALLDGGFDARAIGTRNASLLGAGQHIFAQRIEVPEAQAEEARELVAALLGGGELVPGIEGEADDDEGDDDDDDDEARPALAPRRRGVAFGLGLIFPGGSHYYTQQPLTGLLVTAAFFAGLFWGLSLGAGAATAACLATLVGADLVGGQLAIGARKRGAPLGPVGQLLQGLVIVGIALLIAAAMGR